MSLVINVYKITWHHWNNLVSCQNGDSLWVRQYFSSSGMWQYSNIGGEGGSVGPSTSSVHPSPSTGHQVGAAPGTQPELTDMLQILDQSAPTNFEDLNMFNTNFE